MPVYEYECVNGHLTERIRPVSSRNDPMQCADCGLPARLIMSLPAIRTDDNNPLRQMATSFACPDAGNWSRSKLKAYMAEKNTVITNGSDRDIAARAVSVAKHERNKTLDALEGQYKALPRESKTYVSQSEYGMLSAAERRLVPKTKIVPYQHLEHDL